MNEQLFDRIAGGVRRGIIFLSLASISLSSQPCAAQVSVSHPITDTQDAIPEPAIPAILKTLETPTKS